MNSNMCFLQLIGSTIQSSMIGVDQCQKRNRLNVAAFASGVTRNVMASLPFAVIITLQHILHHRWVLTGALVFQWDVNRDKAVEATDSAKHLFMFASQDPETSRWFKTVMCCTSWVKRAAPAPLNPNKAARPSNHQSRKTHYCRILDVPHISQTL